MEKNIKKFSILSLASVAACCMAGAMGLSVVSASVADDGNPVVTNSPISMLQGASVRIDMENEKNGIRFSAIVDKTQVSAWEMEYNVTYGMLIAPAEYVQEYAFNYDNVFGENAKYYWESMESISTAGIEDKKIIANLQTQEGYLNDYAKDSTKKVINGSIYDIKEKNVSRDFIGRAYVLLEKDGNVEYIFADYFEGNDTNNTRSVSYVAEQAIDNNTVDSETAAWLQSNYVQPSITQKINALLAGEVNATTIASLDIAYQDLVSSFTEMSYATYQTIEDSSIIAVNARIEEMRAFKDNAYEYVEANETVILNNYVQTPTTTANAVGTYSAYVNGGIFAMPVTNGEVSGNGTWTTANTAMIANGLEIQTQSQNNAQYRVYLPKINYTQYISVSMEIDGFSTDYAATISLTHNSGDGIAAFTRGTLTLAYNSATATLNVTLAKNNGEQKTLAITDSAIINGAEYFTFDVWGAAAYRSIYVGQLTALSQGFIHKTTNVTLNEYSKVSGISKQEFAIEHEDYTYANTVAETQKFAWVNNGDVYALPIIDGKISGAGTWVLGSDVCITNGLELQTQPNASINNSATQFVVFLPKINFAQYKLITLAVDTNNAGNIGLVLGDGIAFGNNRNTSISYAYNITTGSVMVTLSNMSGSKSVEITDAEIINGRKRATFAVWGASQYTSTYVGQVQGEKYEKVYGEPEYYAFDMPSTANLLISGGESYAEISYMGNGSKDVADELRRLMGEATGVELVYNNESTITTNSDVMAVILRKTQGDRQYQLPITALSNDSAYIITQVGMDVAIYSRTKAGLMDGIHGLLNQLFDLKIYTNDCYTFTNQSTIGLGDITDVTVVPDIGYSIVGWDEPFNNPDYAYAMGQELDYLAVGAGWHNMLTLISVEEYQASHPNWFVNNQLNLSYNNFEMVDTVVEKMKAKILENNTTYFSLTQADNEYWSNSATSTALKEKYGANSAEYIIFMNKVAERINLWLQTEAPNRKVELVMIAYRQTLDAPDLTKSGLTDEDKAAVVPYIGSNTLVSVMIAPSYVSWNTPLASQTERAVVDIVNGTVQYSNYTIVQIFNNWKSLTNNLHFWFYSTHYDNYLVPFDSISTFEANYQLAASYTDGMILYQGQRNNGVASDWSRLKIYLQANLAKDVNFNVNTGIDNFMAAYFKEAATAMKDLYTTEKTWLQNTPDIVDAGMIIGGNNVLLQYHWGLKDSGVFNTQYSSKTLLAWMNKINTAYVAIAGYQSSNPELYQTLHDRIELESLTIRYLLVKVYGDTTYDANLNAVYAACQRLGMTSMREAPNTWEQ